MSEMPQMPEKITNPAEVWPEYFRTAPDDTTENIPLLVLDEADTLTLDIPILPDAPKHSWPDIHLPHVSLPHLEKHTARIIRRGAIACATTVAFGFGAAYLSHAALGEPPAQATDTQKEPAVEVTKEPTPSLETRTPAPTPTTSSLPVVQKTPSKRYSGTLPKATRTPAEIPVFGDKPVSHPEPIKTKPPKQTGEPSAETSTRPSPSVQPSSETPRPSPKPTQKPSPTPSVTSTTQPTPSESQPTITPSQQNPQTQSASPSAPIIEQPETPVASQSPELGD